MWKIYLCLFTCTMVLGCSRHQEYCDRIIENIETNLETDALEKAAAELARGERTCKDIVSEELGELRARIKEAAVAQLAAEEAALKAKESAKIELAKKLPIYLEIDEAIWKSQKARPERDAVKYVAKKHGLDNEESIVDAIMILGDQRQAIQAALDKSVANGVIGKVKVQIVKRTEIGPFTAILSITVIGCNPKNLSFLAQTAAARVAQNMPESVDGYRASLWYKGISCSQTSLGTAEWNRKENTLNLK